MGIEGRSIPENQKTFINEKIKRIINFSEFFKTLSWFQKLVLSSKLME